MNTDHNVVAQDLAKIVADFIDMMELTGMEPERLLMIKEFMRFYATGIISTAAGSISHSP
jgi:hypothetical protein